MAAPEGGDSLPAVAPVTAPAAPVAKTARPSAHSADTTGDAFPWGIAGGGAALLIAGAAGLAFASPRRPPVHATVSLHWDRKSIEYGPTLSIRVSTSHGPIIQKNTPQTTK